METEGLKTSRSRNDENMRDCVACKPRLSMKDNNKGLSTSKNIDENSTFSVSESA